VEPLERRLVLEHPLDLHATLGPMQRGRFDPTFRWDGDRAWRALRTPAGPVTVRLALDRSTRTVGGRAWGPGSEWFLDRLPDQVGVNDDHQPLADLLEALPPRPAAELLRTLHRRSPGLRLPRTGLIADGMLGVVLGQRVTGGEALRSHRAIVRRWGTPAPGPGARALGLLLPPHPARLAETPYWAFHRYGVERQRADTIRRVAAAAARLDAAADGPPEEARRAMQRIRGVGIWTSAEVALESLGDPDAVAVGDYHLKNFVGWVLAAEPRATDERMLELLEPYAGQRGRVTRLVMRTGAKPPAYGPKQRIHDFRAS
jgi:3-methyladenine DNA glycosylase/8-oxoguanine DNA glycosylase